MSVVQKAYSKRVFLINSPIPPHLPEATDASVFCVSFQRYAMHTQGNSQAFLFSFFCTNGNTVSGSLSLGI